MSRLAHKYRSAILRSMRVRSRLHGTETRPRLSVHVSNRHIQAQIINDDTRQTLAYVSSAGNIKIKGTMSQKAALIGTEVAKAAKSKKISRVTLDRGSRLYHGRIKALADAARAEGLEF